MQRSVARALRNANFAVDVAADGKEGLGKAEDHAYDAILLDVMLPQLDGWSVLEQLRRTKSTPVIMLTARESVDDKVKGLDLGADDYVPKPFQIPELLARLRAVIRRHAGQAKSTLSVGRYRLNLNSKKLTRGDTDIPLTAREFCLIEYLAIHRGRVVSRTDLYDHLFDDQHSSLSNLLDVNVSRIRSKLGDDFIVTHRGLGYSIE